MPTYWVNPSKDYKDAWTPFPSAPGWQQVAQGVIPPAVPLTAQGITDTGGHASLDFFAFTLPPGELVSRLVLWVYCLPGAGTGNVMSIDLSNVDRGANKLFLPAGTPVGWQSVAATDWASSVVSNIASESGLSGTNTVYAEIMQLDTVGPVSPGTFDPESVNSLAWF